VNCGFTAEAVGRAVREIPESSLTKWWEVLREPMSEGKSREQVLEFMPLLVLAEGRWRVKKTKDVKKLLKETLDDVSGKRGLFILHFVCLLAEVHDRLVEKRKGKRSH
jgi:hypothetical protein